MTNSFTPCAENSFIRCQRIGRAPISTIGLGLSHVSSLIRVPRPPARITAFMGADHIVAAMADPGRPTLSVIVVTYNERALVERSLPPLVAQLGEGDELIVADNRSTDGTVDAVRRVAPAATVLEMASNDGYMPAANAAAELACGDLLLTLDADAVVEPGFCEAIRRPALDGRGWALWMGLVTMDGGRLVNTSGGVLHYTGIGW